MSWLSVVVNYLLYTLYIYIYIYIIYIYIIYIYIYIFTIAITKSLMQNMPDLEEDWKNGEAKNGRK